MNSKNTSDNTQAKALNKTDVSGSLSKNQIKHFVRIFIGSTSLFNDFGLDEIKNTNCELIEECHAELSKQARKILKNDNAFSNSKEIFEHVKQNYR